METPVPYISDLMHMIGDYYAHGEFGVVFKAKGYGDRLVKIVNLDAENDEQRRGLERTCSSSPLEIPNLFRMRSKI